MLNSTDLDDSELAAASDVANTFSVKYCERFAPLLKAMNASLLLSSYSANSLVVLSSSDGVEIQVTSVFVPRLLGIALNAKQDELTLAAYGQLLQYRRVENPSAHKALNEVAKNSDTIFVPSSSVVTGFLNTHDMVYTADNLLFVNSSFSCIAAVRAGKSFAPIWQPPFISELKPEDRCHLNGMALENGQPAFISSFTTSDKPNSWRSKNSFTGIIMRVMDNQIVADGLSLPHTPRLHQGKLYFCESGAGKLWCIDNPYADNREEMRLTCVGEYPGFTRGLKCLGDLALLGLSRLRPAKDGSERNTDMPLLNKLDDIASGVLAIDLRSGEVVAQLQFSDDVAQIYDLELLADSVNPHIFAWDAEEVSQVFAF